MRKFTQSLLLMLLTVSFSFGQTGASGDPFTSLAQAANVTTAGTYYFDLGGTTFDTHVDANGYVLVAIDFGNGPNALSQGTSLTTATRGILNPTVLTSLSASIEARISTSLGTDVTSANATILDRIVNNVTLNQGVNDNTINDDWMGTNAITFTANAACTTSQGTSLHQNVFHPCGNATTFHWIPNGGYQRDPWNVGEAAAATSFRLWVKGDASLLPVELVSFNAKANRDNQVELNWQTATEIDNDYFTVERSRDGRNWEYVKNINGAGSSTSLLRYAITDANPLIGLSYYRLKQTDFDGKFAYSKTEVVNIKSDTQVEAFPNPTKAQLTIKGDKEELSSITIYNALGQEVTNLININNNSTFVSIDLSNLAAGTYFVKTKTVTKLIYKE